MPKPVVSAAEPVTLVGGADIAPGDLNISLKLAPVLVAADGGANRLVSEDVTPQAVIGDMDSISDAAAARFSAVLHKVAEQDTTDFEKALTRIDAPAIIALGFVGARLDHTLSAFNVVARFPAHRIVLLGPDDIAFLLPPDVVLDLPQGARISLMPLGAAHVATHGLRWDIDRALSPEGETSPSNEVAQGPVSLRTQGSVLAILSRAHLACGLTAVRAR